MAELGLVVIGRNEGRRLRASLGSALASRLPLVYVDSGSSDDSVALARSLGVAAVLELDRARPFSAARARNEGFDRLLALRPDLEFVQFVDGDCELVSGWLERGLAALAADPSVVAIAGHVRERRPGASVYNRLCALEWQRPPGDIAACGGIFMVRAAAYRSVGGFRPEVIAAEDDELCLRLRRHGGRIVMLDEGMVWHDADMTRFGQWWQRARRAGHAYAQGAHLHGRGPERHFVRDTRRILGWGLLVPTVALALAWPTGGWSLALLGTYLLLFLRITWTARRRGWDAGDSALYAAFAVLSKFAGLVGLLEFHWRRLRGGGMTIIEHKRTGTSA
jgi:GT2 family glycosyltransferase